MKTSYQFKITLAGSKPPIWRRVIVPSTYTLNKLHKVIQICFAWDGCHLFDFNIHGENIDDENPRLLSTKLYKLGLNEKDKFKYTYDFGDDWEHIILLEKILYNDDLQNLPCCLKGRRASPPEDCGGIVRYEHSLEVLANKDHPDYENVRDWMGGDVNPELFYLDWINQQLASLR